MPDPRPIGDRLDALGVKAQLGPEDLIDGAVVLLRVVTASGDRVVVAVQSEGLDYVSELGMLAAATARRTARLGSAGP
ncbi:hypothetical protein [Streptomyces sp. NPDC049881]|uniref:hypothetical protein n=1 Tax=Streptomyces sp. NPDC049881 TaxID=3155778 RepID=UPI00343FA011